MSFSRPSRLLAICLLFSTLVQPFPALAAFDSPAHWEVSRETDFQAENRYRYDAPSRLLNSWLTTEQVEEILSDSRGRIDDPFRVPRRLEPKVRFWLKIYTVYSSQEAVLFDEEHPELVKGKPSWPFKVRVGLQRCGVSVERGRWRLPYAQATLPEAVEASD